MRERLLPNKLSFLFTLTCLFLLVQPAQAQSTCREVFQREFAIGMLKPDFEHNNRYSNEILGKTAIKNQCALGTCHLHAWASGIENGHLRRTGEPIKISMGHLAVSHWIARAVETASSKENFEADGKQLAVRLGATIVASREAIRKFGIIPEEVWSPKTKFELAPVAGRLQEFVVNRIGKARWDLARQNSPEKKAAIIERVEADLNAIFSEIAGEIPNSFEYRGKTYTPQEFAREKFPEIFESRVSVYVNTRRKAPTLRGKNNGDDQVQTNIDNVEQLARAAIDAGEPVILTYEHNGNYVDRTGIMSISAFNLPKNSGPMTREQRAAFGTSSGAHAVHLIGYDAHPVTGKILKWKIQNSWGAGAGDKGIYHMYTDYFRAFVHGISFSAGAKVELPAHELNPEFQYWPTI